MSRKPGVRSASRVQGGGQRAPEALAEFLVDVVPAAEVAETERLAGPAALPAELATPVSGRHRRRHGGRAASLAPDRPLAQIKVDIDPAIPPATSMIATIC